jgi:hypothetical protein
VTEDGLTAQERHTRDLYGNFGRAIYMAQAVEASLKGALVLAQLDKYEVRPDFEQEWNSNFTEMLGRLVPKLVPYLDREDDLVSDIWIARMVRNQLVHHFFWDHTADIQSRDGVDRMIAECQAATALFEEVDERLYGVMLRFAEAHDVAPARRTSLATSEMVGGVGANNCGRCLVEMEVKGSERRLYFQCPECKAVSLVLH